MRFCAILSRLHFVAALSCLLATGSQAETPESWIYTEGRVQYVCFSTNQAGDEPRGRVWIFSQKPDQEISGWDFNSGSFSTISEFEVFIFNGIESVAKLKTKEDLRKVDTTALSQELTARIDRDDHANSDELRYYSDGRGQRSRAFLGFSWNDREGSLALNNGISDTGIGRDNRPDFSEVIQGSVLCNAGEFFR